jgi:hypothetical protein
MARDPAQGSLLARLDAKVGGSVAQANISAWALRVPAVELGGWLFAVDSDHHHGHLYRIDGDTLHHSLIYQAQHKVATPLAVDPYRSLIWVCDVHGECCAVDGEGKVVQRVTLPLAAPMSHPALATAKQTFFVAEYAVYQVKAGARQAHLFATMPARVVALIQIEPELFCIVDQAGGLQRVAANGKVVAGQSIAWRSGTGRVTAVAYRPFQRELLVISSQSELYALDTGAALPVA